MKVNSRGQIVRPRAIENTTETVRENPLVGLLNYATPEGIVASERRGQQQLLQSEELPVNTRGQDAAFLALGFTFGEPVNGDTLFRPATLPDGWRREGSSHAMWSYLVDARGVQRVAIFYKAAFYDRAAHMNLVNVGAKIGDDALYGDEPPTAASLRLDILTDDEKAQIRARVEQMRVDIRECPQVYGKYAKRAEQTLALLD
jgi:hypothetical protein